MKISHLNYWPYYIPGLDKKIKEQAKAARELDIDMDFVIINNQVESRDKNLIFLKLKNQNPIKKKLFRYKVIENIFDFNTYDYVILRYPFNTDFSGISFIKKHGHKIISEHHTNEIGELKSHGSSFINNIRIALESKFSSEYLKYVKAIIGVTNEIVQIELEKIKIQKPTFIFSNGIDVESIKIAKREKINNTLKIIFAASYFSPWHGLDRVLNGLKIYDNKKIAIELHLVGKVPQIYDNDINYLNRKQNIKIINHGFIEPNKIDTLYDGKHLAIGSLALFRKRMKEACALKTRDNIARGVPFFYGYSDSDLDGTEYFAIKIEASESPVNFDEIVDFALNLENRRTIQEDMREFALSRLDWKIKIKKLYDFIASLKSNTIERPG